MLKRLIFKKVFLVMLVSVSFLGAISFKNSSNIAKAMEPKKLLEKKEDFEKAAKDEAIDIFDLRENAKYSKYLIKSYSFCEFDDYYGKKETLKDGLIFKIKNPADEKKDLVVCVTKLVAQKHRVYAGDVFKHVEKRPLKEREMEEKQYIWPAGWYDEKKNNVTDLKVTLKPGEDICLELVYLRPSENNKVRKKVEEDVKKSVENVKTKTEQGNLEKHELLDLIDETISHLKNLCEELDYDSDLEQLIADNLEWLKKQREEIANETEIGDEK